MTLRATWGSSLPNSFLAASSISICQAKLLLHSTQAVSFAFAIANFGKSLFCKIEIFQISQMLKNRLTGVKTLGAPSCLGQLIKTAFDVFGKSQGWHARLLFCYTSIFWMLGQGKWIYGVIKTHIRHRAGQGWHGGGAVTGVVRNDSWSADFRLSFWRTLAVPISLSWWLFR